MSPLRRIPTALSPRRLRRALRRRGGAVGVEFVIVSLMLIAVIAGTLQICGFVMETLTLERGASGLARLAASIDDDDFDAAQPDLQAALLKVVDRPTDRLLARIYRFRLEKDADTGKWVAAPPQQLTVGSLDAGAPTLCSAGCGQLLDAALPDTYLVEAPGGGEQDDGWSLTAVELQWTSGTLGSEMLFGSGNRRIVRWLDNGVSG